MIRLNYSSSGGDTNALFCNVQISASEVLYSLTSSYDQSKWELSGSIVSNKTQGGEQGKAKGFGRPGRRETMYQKRQRQKQEQQNRKITDLSVVPEDQVRYMTIF